MDYGPFGENLRAAITFPVEQFAQLARDAETGQDYAQARHYAAGLGRFTRVDPVYAGLFDPQKWNRYAYARSSPITSIDPSGLDETCTTTFCEVVRGFPTDVILMTKGGVFTGNGGDASAASWQNSAGRGGRPTPPPGDGPAEPNAKNKTPDSEERPCNVPPAPPITNVNENIQTTRSVRRVVQIGMLSNPRLAGQDIDWWVGQVRTGGDWDYKQYAPGPPDSPWEDFGNFNAGATGRALGLPKWMIHAGAGACNVLSAPERLFDGSVSWRYFFDDRTDYEQVAAGIRYVDKNCDKNQ